MTDEQHGPRVTSPQKAEETIEVTKNAFYSAGLHEAWERVAALVVQPGIEFGNRTIHDYQSHKTKDLSSFIKTYPNLVYEAHSTDYQTPQDLASLVDDGFAILKVGPWLTYAYRETLIALEHIEKELLQNTSKPLSNLQAIMHEVMLKDPSNWRQYYTGDEHERGLDRVFSFSDRIRYYWADDKLKQSVSQLTANLTAETVPLTLISQFLPEQYKKIRNEDLSPTPQELIRDSIYQILDIYHAACGFS